MLIEEIILSYKMNEEESFSLRICFMYISYVKKVIPEYKISFSLNKDPRKTNLFKYCYKLYNETKDKLKPIDYFLYIRAQVDILKSIASIKNTNVLLEPQCLVGEKAWKRWLVWYKKYCQTVKIENYLDLKLDDQEVIKELEKTKLFLDSKKDINQKLIFKWFRMGLVSGYYLVLSPLIKQNPLDMSYYNERINNYIKDTFKEIFIDEYTDF